MGYTVHGVLQARILEWVPFPFSGGRPNPGIDPRSPALQVYSLPAEPQGKPKNTGACRLSFLEGIFPTQESSKGLLHCRQILYQLSYQGYRRNSLKLPGFQSQSSCCTYLGSKEVKGGPQKSRGWNQAWRIISLTAQVSLRTPSDGWVLPAVLVPCCQECCLLMATLHLSFSFFVVALWGMGGIWDGSLTRDRSQASAAKALNSKK